MFWSQEVLGNSSKKAPTHYFPSLFLNRPSFPFFLSESTLFNMRFKLFYFIDVLILC